MAFTMVEITHDFDLPDGIGALGTVEFTPVEPMHNVGSTKSGTVRKALTAGGYLSVPVAATNDPDTTPLGVVYRIVVRLTAQPARTYYAPVPYDRGSVLDLAQLLEWAAAAGLGDATPVTLSAFEGIITPDLALGSVFRHYAQGDVILADPPAGGDGRRIDVQVFAEDVNRVLTVAGSPTTIPANTWWWGRLSFSVLKDQWILEDGYGSVTSVNGQVNVVMLDADDIPDGSGKVIMTTAERTKLDGVAPGATVYTSENARDDLGSALVAGANVTITPDDGANTITIAAATSGASGIPGTIIDAKGDLIAGTANDTPARLAAGTNGQLLSANSATTTGLEWVAPGAGSTDPEVVRDTIATALVGGAGIIVTPNDPSDIITLSTAARTVRTVNPSGGVIAINADTAGDAVDSALTGDATLNVPTNGSTGQAIQGTAFASGAQRVLTFHASFGRLTGIGSTLTIPSGKLGRYSIRRTDLTGSAKWLVEAAGVEQ